MSKCYMCGKEAKVEIKLVPRDNSGHALPEMTRILCGKCAVGNGIIADKEMAAMVLKLEEKGEE